MANLHDGEDSWAAEAPSVGSGGLGTMTVNAPMPPAGVSVLWLGVCVCVAACCLCVYPAPVNVPYSSFLRVKCSLQKGEKGLIKLGR